MKNMLSLDIGTCHTKIVQGKVQNNMIHIEKAFIVDTPPGSYDDGNILSMERLKEVLEKALIEHGIKGKKTVCILGSTSTITREIVLPFAEKKELDTMVRYEIEQYLPIMLNEYVVEYKILENFIEEGISKLRILVAALPVKFVEGYLELLSRLKLQPMALDIHANGISKVFDKAMFINDEKYNGDHTVAIIDFGHSYTHVNIMEKDLLRFSRVFSQGGRDIDVNIANAFNLSIPEGEKKKMEYSPQDDESILSPASMMLGEIIHSSIDGWNQEIQRIFQYYTSRATGNRIDKIYLYGGNGRIHNIASLMTSFFNIPTTAVETMSNIRLAKEEGISLINYLNAIAALVRR